MKKLIALTIISITATLAHAGDGVVPLGTGSGGVLRSNANLYRPIPRPNAANPNASGSERARQIVIRPTQHYYLRENVVSYRYIADTAKSRGASGNPYLGPSGARFTPGEEGIPPNSGFRNFATVHKRAQPGVPMVNKTVKAGRTAGNELGTGKQIARK